MLDYLYGLDFVSALLSDVAVNSAHVKLTLHIFCVELRTSCILYI